MGKLTLLDMVQDILSDMNSDEVNSYSDTVESLQVAKILETSYRNLISERLWPRERSRVTLTALSDPDTPTHFRIPDNVQTIEFLKYDTRDSAGGDFSYSDITHYQPKDFLELCLGRSSSATNVQTVTDTSGTKLLIINDQAPTVWTTFDDEYVIFDSFDEDVENTLQSSKLICYAEVEPTWTYSDTFVPPGLPAKAFPYLLAEAKSMCFITVKESPNVKVEQLAKRFRSRLMQDKYVVDGRELYPNYGRK